VKIASKKKAATTAAVADPHEHLSRTDEKLARVIARAVACPFPGLANNPPDAARSFRALVHAIVSQQLSGKAADTIFGRVEALGGGTLPGPAELATIPDEKLRAAGLSGAKTRGVKDLAARVLEGELDLDTLHGREDDAVIELLTQVRGIGRWTAEMFLMFRLGRLDILSTADLGLRKGLMRLHGLRDLPDPATMERLTAHWRPFRSVGCWYLWRVAEEAPPARKEPGAKKAAAKKKPVAKKKAPAKKQVVAKKSRADRILSKR
jgi:DNA-3-methyladenine glycosylase II